MRGYSLSSIEHGESPILNGEEPPPRPWTQSAARSAPTSVRAKRIQPPLYSLAGITLLYSSAYFLPALTPKGLYFFHPEDLGRFCAAALGQFMVFLCLNTAVYAGARALLPKRWVELLAFPLFALLVLLAAKGLFDVYGMDWYRALPAAWGDPLTVRRAVKVCAFLASLALLGATSRSLAKWSRALASLGFAFGILAVCRIVWLAAATPHAGVPPAAANAATAVHASSVEGPAAAAVKSDRPKRVVWVIFDETDLGPIHGRELVPPDQLPNFKRLAAESVSAVRANSPASSTVYSIPALLSGVPLGGAGMHIGYSGRMALQRPDSQWVSFDEGTSIFGALAQQGRSASVLGFYHPYCKLFDLRRCQSFSYPEIYGLPGALLTNLPDSLWARGRELRFWGDITSRSLALLPEYLARDDDLTFVHLNVPHLPAAYANRVLGLQGSADPLVDYAHNLRLADSILGQIITQLSGLQARHELLLVVSTDHWFRTQWFSQPEPDSSRPIPLMVWRVGDREGYPLTQPVSSVHTAAMILDFLDGKIDTQAEIAAWWQRQPVIPAFIAPIS